MSPLSILLFIGAIISLIIICMYLMLKSINDSACHVSTILSYSAMIRDFNSIVFMSDSGRYSAEIIVRSKINDTITKLISEQNKISGKSTNVVDTALIQKKLAVVKKIDSMVPLLRDDVIYYIISTSTVDDNPEFIYMMNDPDYPIIILDYNSVYSKFSKLSKNARALAKTYNASIDDTTSDKSVYNTLLNG